MIPHRAVGQVAKPAVVPVNVGSAYALWLFYSRFMLFYVQEYAVQPFHHCPARGFSAVAEVYISAFFDPFFHPDHPR